MPAGLRCRPLRLCLRASSKGQDAGFSTRQYRFESGCPCHFPRDGGVSSSVALAGIVQGSRQRSFTPRIPVRIRLPVPPSCSRSTRPPGGAGGLQRRTAWVRFPAGSLRSLSVLCSLSALRALRSSRSALFPLFALCSPPRPDGSQAPVFETGRPGSTPGGGAATLTSRFLPFRSCFPSS